MLKSIIKDKIKAYCEHCNTENTFVDLSNLTCAYCQAPLRPSDDLLLAESLFSKVGRVFIKPRNYLSLLILATSDILPLDQMAAHIIDISKWQYKWNGKKWILPDFEKMLSETDMIHVIHKASQGTYTDPCYQIGIDAMWLLGIKVGTYHYCDPYFTPEESAEHYAEQINAIPESEQWGTKAYPQHWLDCENRIGRGGIPLTRDELTNWIKAFIDRLEQLTSQPFGIYTREIWWNDYVLRNTWAHKYALWIARYNSWITDPGAPLDWSNYGKVAVLWQRDADGNGLGSEYGVWSRSIDRNRSPVYTTQQVYEIIGNYEPPPETVIPPDKIVVQYDTGEQYCYERT